MKRKERLKNSSSSSELNKIRREISRQRMDLIREGQALPFMEFLKLHKGQRIQSKNQTSTSEVKYNIPESMHKKLTLYTLSEDKKNNDYRPIMAATSYRNQIGID